MVKPFLWGRELAFGLARGDFVSGIAVLFSHNRRGGRDRSGCGVWWRDEGSV